MKLEAIKLRFYTPVHLGRGLEEMDKSGTIYHSDSLKSAIFSVGLAYYPHWAENDAETFFAGFQISSCFPYAGEEYFLPKPLLNIRFEFQGISEDRLAKTGKKISFLSVPVFSRFVNSAEGGVLRIDKKQLSRDGEFICENPVTASRTFYRTELQQRVSVPREGDEGQPRPFYLDRIYFEEGCGMYFLADFKENSTLREEVLQALKLLGDQGIGTDRTVGNGLFSFDPSIDVSSIELDLQPLHGRKLALGLFLPAREEFENIDLDKSSWMLLKRGGYMGGTSEERFLSIRKNSIYFWGEGSVFASDTPLKGKKVDLKPEWGEPMHPVWRDGQCLFLEI